jgi:hypothetical protein
MEGGEVATGGMRGASLSAGDEAPGSPGKALPAPGHPVVLAIERISTTVAFRGLLPRSSDPWSDAEDVASYDTTMTADSQIVAPGLHETDFGTQTAP